MDNPENNNTTGQPIVNTPPAKSEFMKAIDAPLTWQNLRRFFQLTGGSWLYSLSAVFITYGIVKLLGPVLESSDKMAKALPCLFTLHIYELALLAALVIIVLRKVVDDAISLVIIMALFLVGTAIATGSAVNKDISTGFTIAAVGVALAVFKLGMMRRFAGIPFGLISAMGLVGIMVCNYFGPVLMARNIMTAPSDEPARKTLWMLLYIGVMVTAGLVWYTAARTRPLSKEPDQPKVPFLQKPNMVYLFAILLAAASGVNLYTMEYSSGLRFAWADFIPLAAVLCMLAMEMLRHTGRRFGVWEIVISCIPLAATFLAIDQKNIIASGQLSPHIICYPPVMLTLCGLLIGAIAFYHRWYPLRWVVLAYALGVILTAGYSLEKPHSLNFKFCGLLLVAALVVYGLIIRKPAVCLAGLVILCIGAFYSHRFGAWMTNWQLTPLGGSAGLWGIGCLALTIVFGKLLHPFFRTTGTFAISLFIYDFLPAGFHWRYLVMLIAAGLIVYVIWIRMKELYAALILSIPLIVRSFMATQQFSYWRFIGLGFLLLVFGTFTSLLKQPAKKQEQNLERSKP